MQPVLGRILDSHWDGVLESGARIYSSGAYFSAFLWFLVLTALSVVMVLFTKESYCRVREA